MSIYERSLELMDAHFDSISDEEFLHSYLEVEEFKGPLVEDFLSEASFLGYSYRVKSEASCIGKISKTALHIDINYIVDQETKFDANTNSINFEVLTISTKNIESLPYDSSQHVANDELYQIATYA